MVKEILVTLGILVTLSGCAYTFERQMNAQNIHLEKTNQPHRLYKTKSTDKADYYTMEWAGTKGKSIALNSDLLYSDIFKTLKLNCGFDETDLLETRIVSYKLPIFYEVWVFNDSLSKREDKTSGMSIIMNQLLNGGGVDINIIGHCHSEPTQFIFGK